MGTGKELRHWMLFFWGTLGTAALLLVSATLALAGSPPETAETARAFAVCERATSRWERISDVPDGLLQAISLAESGRWSKADKRVRAWPWTVTSGGPGSYYATKAAALAEVRRLQAKGVENIDVGCMQVNMQYHGHEFIDVAHAMDPDINVAYAAKFLGQLRENAASWPEAAGYYHSMTPERTAYYRGKVEKIWAGLGKMPQTPDAPATPDSLQATVAAIDPATALGDEKEPSFIITPIDVARTRAMNDRFTTLKNAARKLRDELDPDARRQRELDAWRSAKGRASAIQSLLAQRNAELAARRERELKAAFTVDKDVAFAEKRRQQLAEWRQRASGATN